MPKDERYSAICSHCTLNSGMQQLQGARNVMITGGSFRQVEENHYDGGRDAGLHILGQHIATDAMYNSAERFPPAKCHPGTHEKIISTILDWINDPTPKERALWLNGPAGAGKSAITHSIAVYLKEISDDSKYAGSFFFTKDAVRRGDGTKLFSTISYQLALNFPSFRAQIDAAMLDNPTLPTASIDVQLRCLIIEPLLRVTNWPAHNPTVIIDGLDECAGSKRMQSEILSLLSKAITEHNIPLRFLIVSRPEYWISNSFEIGPLVHVTKSLCLRDNVDANRDIEKYLREGFNKIYDENIRIMSSTPLPWPPDYIIQRFVGSASGQFVYASTVLEFVGASSNFCNPREQLRILTTPGPHQASAFSDLDKLYATILSSYPRPNTMKRVLGGLLLHLSEKMIQEMLGVDSGEIQLVLRALSSLIRISTVEYSEELRALEPIFGSPLVNASISFSHLSFREFLLDESRSGGYAIDESAVGTEFICAIIKLGVDIVEDRPRAEQTIERIGLSIYRDMLYRLQYLPIRVGLDVGSIANVLEELCESLHKIIVCKPSHAAQPSHLYWFTIPVLDFLTEMPIVSPFNFQYWRKNHRHLLRSLADVLTVAQTISAQQIIDRSPKNSATFAYITLYSSDSSSGIEHSIKDILEVMNIGLDTIISDLQHLPDLVCFDFTHSDRGYLGYIHIGPVFSAVHHKVQGQCQENQHVGAWDPQIASLSAQHFDRIYRRNDGQLLVPPQRQFVRTAECFLRYSRISDIHSKEYFEDPKKMEIFNIIMDTSFWDRLPNIYEDSIQLILGALGWFNRQMTEPSKGIIRDHDSRLPQTMLYVAKRIFEIGYLPYFTDSHYSKLWMISDRDEIPSVCLHITPPPHVGPYSIVEEMTMDPEHWAPLSPRINSVALHIWISEFHEQVLDKQGCSIISPYDWYPHLAAFLLTGLVKNQYAALNANFEQYWEPITKKFFLPFIKCLPYAIPTQHNLNALRALHYLYPKIHPSHQWRPPFGFCSLAIDFLKKYNRSSLSSTEFGSLKDWLSGLRTRESRRILQGNIRSYRHVYDAYDDYTTDEGES